MSSTIRELARRAGEIFEAPLPGPVAERARLQHLSLAGAVQVMSSDPGFAALAPGAGSRGAAALCLGGRAPRREAIKRGGFFPMSVVAPMPSITGKARIDGPLAAAL